MEADAVTWKNSIVGVGPYMIDTVQDGKVMLKSFKKFFNIEKSSADGLTFMKEGEFDFQDSPSPSEIVQSKNLVAV